MLSRVTIPVAAIAGIKPTHLSVLAGLLSFTDRAGRCWPSLRTLGRVCGMTLSRVQRAISEMETAGILTRARRGAGTLYQLAERFLWQAMSPASETPSPTSGTEGEAKKEKEGLKIKRDLVRREAPPPPPAEGPNPFARRRWLRRLNAYAGERLSGALRMSAWEVIARAEAGALDRTEQRLLDQLDRMMRGGRLS